MPRTRAALPVQPPAPTPSPRPREAARPPAMGLRSADAGIVLLFLGLTFLLGVFPQNDMDYYWHLRTGDLIRARGMVPHTDWYTFGAAGHTWIDLHWGFEVALSVLYGLGGVDATILAKCVVTTLAVGLLLTARRREWPLWVMVAAWLPALLLLGGRMYVRPETATLLYLAADLAILARIDRRPRLAWLLPVVQVFWVNTQGLFVLGPILVGMAIIDASLRRGAFAPGRRTWWRTILGATLATGLACLLNPYGLIGALFPLQLAGTMTNPVFENIAELQSIPKFIERSGVRNLPLAIHLLVLALGGLSFVAPIFWRVYDRASAPPIDETKKRKKKGKETPAEPPWRLSPFRLMLFGAFSLLSLKATRNSHQFAAVVGTVTAWNFGEWAAALARRRAEASRGRPSKSALALAPRLAVAGGVALTILLVGTGQFYAWAGEGRTVGWGERPLWFPHAASKFAGSEGMPGRFLVFHNGHAGLFEYDNGPGRKVYADARLEVMGPEVYAKDRDLARDIVLQRPGWSDRIVALGPPTPGVLVDHVQRESAGLATAMLGASAWRCVYYDETASVYVHEQSGFAGASVDLAARHFGVQADSVAHAPAALLQAAQALVLQASGLAGRSLQARKMEAMLALAEGYATRAQDSDRDSFEARRIHGQVESLRAMLRHIEPSPRHRMPFDPIADIPFARATYAWSEANRLLPNDFVTLLARFQLAVQREMYEEASGFTERLLALPMTPEREARLDAIKAEMGRARAAAMAPAETKWSNRGELERALTRLLANGRARSAADLLESAYKPPERTWEQSDRLATIRLHLGRPDQARIAWREAADVPRPALRDARVAVTYLVEGDFEAARRSYRSALAVEPDLFEAHYGLAILERDAGRAPDCLAAARAAEAKAGTDAARAAAREIVELAGPYAGSAK